MFAMASGGNFEVEPRLMSNGLEKSSIGDRSMEPEGDRVELSGIGYRS